MLIKFTLGLLASTILACGGSFQCPLPDPTEDSGSDTSDASSDVVLEQPDTSDAGSAICEFTGVDGSVNDVSCKDYDWWWLDLSSPEDADGHLPCTKVCPKNTDCYVGGNTGKCL